MAGLTDLSIRRPVATTMVYLILIVVGLVSFRTLPVDLLPKVEFTELTVRVRYPNVGPEEVEQIITDPIENAVSGLPNLERITSRSEEGSSRIRLRFARGTNIDEAANDLRAALDRLRDELPMEAEAPEIFKLDLDMIEVVSLAATSTRDLEQLTRSWSRTWRGASSRSPAWERSTSAAASIARSGSSSTATGCGRPASPLSTSSSAGARERHASRRHGQERDRRSLRAGHRGVPVGGRSSRAR